MNATWIGTVFEVIDTTMQSLEHHRHLLTKVPDSEVLTVAVVAAKHFQNHHERALAVLQALHYLSGPLSPSRFNRRLHALSDWLLFLAETLGEVLTEGEVFVIDRLPLPVCRRVRARRCRKVRGRLYCGSCAAKDEKFFGWRLHLICTPQGVPVRLTMLPASLHDLTPIHELTASLPGGSRLFGDKGSNSAKDEGSILEEAQVRLLPVRRKNMKQHEWFVDELELREYRHTLETVNSQAEAMGIERLHARTNAGVEVKVHASLIALQCWNTN
jgi:hypothetical protein